MKPKLLINLREEIGVKHLEGPVWDARTKRVFAVDITGKCVIEMRFQGRSRLQVVRVWQGFEDNIGAVCLTSDPKKLLVAMGHRLALLDLTSGQCNPVVTPFGSTVEAGLNTRWNDCKVGPEGRFYGGTMDYDCRHPIGGVYRVESDRTCVRVLGNMTIANGLCWDPADDWMYHIDSPTRVVARYDYDPTSGDLSNGKIVVDLRYIEGADDEKNPSVPDGMTIDGQGRIYVAIYNCDLSRPGRVVICNPRNGEIIDTVEIPAPRVTCPCFAGPDRDLLVVTTTPEHMTADELEKHPLSGSIFGLEVGVTGQDCYKFRLP